MSTIITKIAKKEISIEKYFKEFSKEYFLLYTIKIAISVFSVVSSYYFVYSKLKELLNSTYLAVFFAVTVLLLLELSSYYTIGKLAKFALKKHIFNSIVFFCLAVPVLIASAVLSANGLSTFVESKQVSVQIIDTDLQKNVENISIQYDTDIELIRKKTVLIENNPAGWSGGKRSFLTSKQLNEISQNTTKILALTSEKRNAIETISNKFELLKSNEIATINQSSTNYYNLTMFIILIQFVLSFIFQYMSTNVIKSIDNKAFILNELKEYKNRVLNSINLELLTYSKTLFSGIAFNYSNELNSIAELSDDTIPDSQNTTDSQKQKRVEPPKRVKVNGFINSNVNENNTDVNARTDVDTKSVNTENITAENKTDKTSENTQNTTGVNGMYGIGICPVCSIEFVKNSYNHKFCTELHRIEYYEKKTGKNLSRYKNLYK